MTQASLESWTMTQLELSGRHAEIITCMAHNNRPVTIYDISLSLNLPINSISGRMTELHNLQKVIPTGSVMDEKTRRPRTLWRLR